MPEAPEAATVLSVLEKQIKGIPILKGEIFHPKLAANMEPAAFEKALEGQSIQSFSRIGKYLILRTEDYVWIVHLRMEGKFYIEDVPKEDKHIHARFHLADGRSLAYHDVRKFGRMYLYPKTDDLRSLPALSKLGPDVLDDMPPEALKSKLKGSRPIKSALLDQSVIAGIGNIYADEILFSCGIHPETPSKDISLPQCQDILHHTKRIMKGAMKAGGTTIRSYTSSLGVSGRFQLELKVHRRQGEPCPICQTPIEKITVGQRSTYLCPNCQKSASH